MLCVHLWEVLSELAEFGVYLVLLVQLFFLKISKCLKSWLVQLATSTKRKVTNIVINCKIMLNDFLMHVNVNVFPLGSCDLLIGMDWLEEHKIFLNFFDKNIYMY